MFSITGQVSNPKSATIHSVDRWQPFKQDDMQTEKLNDKNKAVLKSNLIQTCLPYIVASIVVTMVLGAVYILIDRTDLGTFPISKDILFWSIFSIVVLLYAGIMFKALRPATLDLMRKIKIVQLEIIKDKKFKTSHSYHVSAPADLTNQPVLKEYFFKLNDIELQVSEQEYKNFEIGDRIKISITKYTKKVIQIEKE